MCPYLAPEGQQHLTLCYITTTFQPELALLRGGRYSSTEEDIQAIVGPRGGSPLNQPSSLTFEEEVAQQEQLRNETLHQKQARPQPTIPPPIKLALSSFSGPGGQLTSELTFE